MKNAVRGIALLAFLVTCFRGHSQDPEGQWPSFRGYRAQGTADAPSVPVTWNVEQSRNIKWKIPIPGLSHSSPIIWDDHVYIAAAVSSEDDPTIKVGLYGSIFPVDDEPVHEWKLYCVDKNTGDILWNRTAHSVSPQVKRHPKSTHANSTPDTDGNHVVAFFGSEGLYCYGSDGELHWKKGLGILDSGYFKIPEAQWGFASSPIIHDGKIIVQCDVNNMGFIAAYDIDSGEEVWRTSREDVPTWSTPTIHLVNGKAQIVVNGYNHAGAYDFLTGREVWKITGGGDIPTPTPVAAHGLIFINNAHGPASPIYAIKEDATGDISLKDDGSSNEHIVWSVPKGGAYMQTSIVYGDYFYNCQDNGQLSCFNAKTGELMYRERIGSGGFTASAVASDGKLYYTGEKGVVYVVKTGPSFEILAQNTMGEICMATPAISEGTIFFRTHHSLVAVSAQ